MPLRRRKPPHCSRKPHNTLHGAPPASGGPTFREPDAGAKRTPRTGTRGTAARHRRYPLCRLPFPKLLPFSKLPEPLPLPADGPTPIREDARHATRVRRPLYPATAPMPQAVRRMCAFRAQFALDSRLPPARLCKNPAGIQRIKPTPPFRHPSSSFRRKPESRIESARFALLCDAEGARKRGIPAFAGMTRNEAGMTEKGPEGQGKTLYGPDISFTGVRGHPLQMCGDKTPLDSAERKGVWGHIASYIFLWL